MALGTARVRGAIIATTAAAALVAGTIAFAAQSSADTTQPAAPAVPVKPLLTPATQVGKAITFTVAGKAGGVALVEWDAAEAPAGVTFTSYSVWFTDLTPPKPTPGTSPPPQPGVPPPSVASRNLPATARSAEFTGLNPNVTYGVHVAAHGQAGQTPVVQKALRKTTLGLTASPATAVYGSPVTLSGQVAGSGEGARSAELVTLERRATGTSTWSRVGAVRTGQDLRWSLVTKPAGITAFRATYAGSKGYWPATTTSTVTVRYLVSIKASAAKPGRTATLSGAVRPAKAGVKISLQRLAAGAWVTIAGGATRADGSYAITRTFTKGTWPLRVVAAGGTTLAYGTSGQVTLAVK